MDQEKLAYIISLQLVPKVGPKTAKNLIAYCGSPEAVFTEKKSHLTKIPGVGIDVANSISSFSDFQRAEEEIRFLEKNDIKALFFLEKDYPERLRDIEDAPLILFHKGKGNLNPLKIVGIVGTRNASDYGEAMCNKLVAELKEYNATIVSGLAYGIDSFAHRAALKNQLPTFGVLGHGLHTIYPYQNRELAVEMLPEGGLLTEFLSGSKPDRENFPKRNRIVAGMVDALIVVETAKRGGALITAEIAYSYNRELFVVPGKAGDKYSEGCNNLIRLQKAYIVEKASDIAYHMGWEKSKSAKTQKKPDLSKLNPMEKIIVQYLQANGKTYIEKLSQNLNLKSSELSMILLDLEFKGYIQNLPGNLYKLSI